MGKASLRKKIKMMIGMICVFLLVLAVLAVNFLAASIARPRRMSLEEEKSWEKEKGLWGNFDSYEREPYTVAGRDGYQLHCELVKNRGNSSKYVILTHGFGSNRYGSVKYADVYEELGYNCIIYDVRGHGENEKTAVSLGQFESEDLLALIRDCYERYGDNIELGLHGESMGSSISLSVLAFDPDLDFVVADCGFTNLYSLMDAGYRRIHLSWLTPLVNLAVKVRFGFDMKKTSAVDALAENEIPVCLIHGEEDSLIPPSNSEELSRAQKGCSELHIVKKAGHAESRMVLGSEGYQEILEAFLKRNKKSC